LTRNRINRHTAGASNLTRPNRPNGPHHLARYRVDLDLTRPPDQASGYATDRLGYLACNGINRHTAGTSNRSRSNCAHSLGQLTCNWVNLHTVRTGDVTALNVPNLQALDTRKLCCGDLI
jgi:hypothetical protein